MEQLRKFRQGQSHEKHIFVILAPSEGEVGPSLISLENRKELETLEHPVPFLTLLITRWVTSCHSEP